MAARADVRSIMLLAVLFMVSNYGISCYGCGESIRRNQTSEKCCSCGYIFHLKCLTDRIDENIEKFYCSEYIPPDEPKISYTFYPVMADFIAKRGMKFLHQNINGICGKLDIIKSFLSDAKNCFHIVSFSETHTNDTVLNSELFVPGYILERKDRENGRDGGVSFYIREDLQYRRRCDLEIDGIEFSWIELFIPKSKSLLLCSAYRPPDSSKFLDKNFISKFDNMLDTISVENKETITCGDFNCDYNLPRVHSNIKDLVKLYNYSQVIKSSTRISKESRTLIDLIFTTDKSKINDSLVYTNFLSDHCLIGISRKTNCKRYPQKNIKARDYSKYNKEDLKNEIRNVPWENCLTVTDLNQAWNLFKYYLSTAINKHAPLKEKTVRGKSNPWITREIRNLMNTRDYHHRRFKRSNSTGDWESYKSYRNSVTNRIRVAKANHVRAVLKESSANPRDFWKQIKSCYPTKDSSSPSKTFVINGTVTSKVS
ncbi:uncharacterized protein LOC130645960 [Hydractinia symbiolongicarpus]|uniref:uncharacterized protein LOC130645960 n=1 Tax=Hydractinia symbiolongicarpus TaxID=13093 RepID=UPI00255117E9|nr:uncharacterized protein LOC130645960 [Hydractinia symbiolongicarpus]